MADTIDNDSIQVMVVRCIHCKMIVQDFGGGCFECGRVDGLRGTEATLFGRDALVMVLGRATAVWHSKHRDPHAVLEQARYHRAIAALADFDASLGDTSVRERVVADGTGIEWRRVGDRVQHRYSASLFGPAGKPGPWIDTPAIEEIRHPARVAAIAAVRG